MLTSRIRHVVVAAALVAIVVAAGSQAGAQEKSRMDIVLERGKLIVVTLTTVPPFAFNDDKGQLVGFDIDIARLVAGPVDEVARATEAGRRLTIKETLDLARTPDTASA